MWKGKWNDIHIVGKKLAIKIVNKRISRDFSEEYSKLRFVDFKFIIMIVICCYNSFFLCDSTILPKFFIHVFLT